MALTRRHFLASLPAVAAFAETKPLKITAVEVSGGYRFAVRRYPKVVPYVAFGVGSYSYKETSDFSAPGEDLDTRHVGELVLGGLELRLHRWVGLSFDGQFTHIPGILVHGRLDLGSPLVTAWELAQARANW